MRSGMECQETAQSS
uniref:Uncharacterized protein n=1 Tax=Moniliophthora roreri TaxID=221103 RepID=A0A0W0FYQ7_MONRR